jgi:hypothetical protein
MSKQPTTHGTTYTQHPKKTRQTSIPSAGLEPAIPASNQPQTYAFDYTAIGTGYICYVIKHQRPDDSKQL